MTYRFLLFTPIFVMVLGSASDTRAETVIANVMNIIKAKTRAEKTVLGADAAVVAKDAATVGTRFWGSESDRSRVAVIEAGISQSPAPFNAMHKAMRQVGDAAQGEIAIINQLGDKRGSDLVAHLQALDEQRSRTREAMDKPITMSASDQLSGTGGMLEIGAMLLEAGEWLSNSFDPFMQSGGTIDMSSVQPEPADVAVPPLPQNLPVPRRRPAFQPYEPLSSQNPALRRNAESGGSTGSATGYKCWNGSRYTYSSTYRIGCSSASYDQPGQSPGAALGRAMSGMGQ